jgi:uncharacterized protein YndB with AHSA1/START domain
MDPKKTGKISKDPDGYRVQFERHYAFDAMTVWDAITNPDKMAVWFMKVEMELKPGARMVIYYNDEHNTHSYGRVTAVEPGKLFEYVWENEDGPDELTRWELFSEGPDACKLVFTHSRIDESYAWRVPSGWHIMLDHLQEILFGRQQSFPADTSSPEELAIKDFYKELINKTFKTV